MAVYLDNYRKHLGGTYPLRLSPCIEVNMILNVLDGCSMNCSGCYVQKKNGYSEKDFATLSDLSSGFTDQGFELNELFVGPTDIYTAKNTLDLMNKSKALDHLLSKYKAMTITSTMMNPLSEVKRMTNILIEKLVKLDVEMEIFVLIDVQKYNLGDKEYLEVFDRNLEVLKNHAEKINVQFATNFYEGMFDKTGFQQISQSIRRDYGVKLRLVPSFCRAKPGVVKKLGSSLKEDLENQLNANFVREKWCFLNMVDMHFGGETFFSYSYSKGHLYVAPFFYDFISVEDKALLIEKDKNDSYTLEDLFKKAVDINVIQYNYANETENCLNCEFLTNCVSRKHLMFMKSNRIKECIVPKKLYRPAFVE